MKEFWTDLIINILAAIIFLIVYETFIKRLFVFFKYRCLKGYYLVCNQDGRPFRNSPDGIPNFVKVDIEIMNPNVIVTKSKDFDRTYTRKWKTWTGRIVMNELTKDYGSGFYMYEEGAEPGLHEIFIKDKSTGTILVRVTDYGKANLKERQDNVPSLQNWRKVERSDPLIKQFKKIVQ